MATTPSVSACIGFGPELVLPHSNRLSRSSLTRSAGCTPIRPTDAAHAPAEPLSTLRSAAPDSCGDEPTVSVPDVSYGDRSPVCPWGTAWASCRATVPRGAVFARWRACLRAASGSSISTPMEEGRAGVDMAALSLTPAWTQPRPAPMRCRCNAHSVAACSRNAGRGMGTTGASTGLLPFDSLLQ